MIGLIKEILYKVHFTFFKKFSSKIGLSLERDFNLKTIIADQSFH